MKLQSCAYGIILIALLAVAGCRETVTGPTTVAQDESVAQDIGEIPAQNGAAGFLPLEVGDVWEYERVFDYVIIDDNDNIVDAQTLTEDVIHEIIGTEERFGREYALNQQTFVREYAEDLHWWDRYRQDKAGLYRADIALGEPPASPIDAGEPPTARRVFHIMPKTLPETALAGNDPNLRRAYEAAWRRLVDKRRTVEEMLQGAALTGPPGGAFSEETAVLRYPLRPGQAWDLRTSPILVHCEVEAREVLHLPAGRFPAWRVRLENSLLGPNDRVHFWYSRRGLLAELIHVESIAIDITGNPIGTLIGDESLDLQSLQLVRPGGQP